MDEVFRLRTVADYNNRVKQETLHPLVSVVDFSKTEPFYYFRMYSELYIIFLKDLKCGNMTYGVGNYDYEEGTLVFISPGQIYGIADNRETRKGQGFALVFHPDLIRGTELGRNIKEYTFFSYEVNEALHLSTRERAIIDDCIEKIQYELEHAIDQHSKTLIVSYIELFLNYCKRFYDRQFITRSLVNKDVLVRFEKVLDEYFLSEKLQNQGLPTVRYCADKLFLSPNYLGDLLKKETGKSAQEHIQYKLIEIAKEKIFDPSKSISDIAYELGFKYPQHFTRMFKKNTGLSPNEFRLAN
jgi:AraC-like DNA-binding protein